MAREKRYDTTSSFPQSVDSLMFLNDIDVEHLSESSYHNQLAAAHAYTQAGNYLEQTATMDSFCASLFNTIENRIYTTQDFLKEEKHTGWYEEYGVDSPFYYGDVEPSSASSGRTKKPVWIDYAPLISIDVTTQPTNIYYLQSDTLNLSGMVVTATYREGDNDTKTVNVTSQVTTNPASGSQLNKVGQNIITVSYTELGVTYTTTFPIYVLAYSSITVTTMPTKTSYTQYETLNLSGLVVTGTSGLQTKNVTSMCTFSPSANSVLSTAGTQTVTVTFNGLSTSFNVSVIALTGIEITTLPTKTRYIIGESLDLTGIVVKSVNANSGKVDITSSCTFTPTDGTMITTEGYVTVTAKYRNYTATFEVEGYYDLPEWNSGGLENNSWDTIAAYARVGKLQNYVNVGDVKTLSLLNNRQVHMQLISFNDGGHLYYPKGTVDFISQELFASSPMKSTNDNNGGWIQSTLRTQLNGTIINYLPQELRQNIRDKYHLYSFGGGRLDFRTAYDTLWIPTEYEIFGTSLYGGENSTMSIYYSFFESNNRRVKAVTSSGYPWWLASTNINNSTDFLYVNSNGDEASAVAYNGYFYPICFRL